MSMEELRDYLETLYSEFASQPAQFREAVQNIPDAAMHRPIEPGGWTPHQVLAHVVAAQVLALQPRVSRILDEDKPDLPDWDQDRWMADEYDREVPPQELLSDLESGVDEVLQRVQEMKLENWNRTGRHPMRGSRTLLWWFEYLIVHNREHVRELSRIGSQGSQP